jgi:sugar phosphate isomerase/epimerase
MFKNLCASSLGVSGHQSEVIELALTYGFHGLDIDIAEFATRAKLHSTAYAMRLVNSARMRLGTFALPVDCEADDAAFGKRLEKLPEFAQVAAEVGCPRCVLTIPPASEVRPYHENFEFYRRRLAEVCTALAPAKIQLGIGFRAAEYLRKGQAFQFIHDMDALTLLMNMVGASNIGLLLDVWDLFVAGGSVDTIRKLRVDQIVAVEVANLPAGVPPAELNDQSRLLPGAEGGAIDMAAVLSALAEIGYKGPITPKPSKGLVKSHRRDAIVKEVGDSLTRVWRAAGLTPVGRPLSAARS